MAKPAPSPSIDRVVRDVWRTVGERPAYLEDVPSDATTSVLELVVQDAERRALRAAKRDDIILHRQRYYARRMGTLLAESDRSGDTDAQRLARLLRDPYIARVTPELSRDQLTSLIASVSHLVPRVDIDVTAAQLAAGPPAEIAFYKVRDNLPSPENLPKYLKDVDGPLTPNQIAEGHRIFLLLGFIRSAPPTWDMDKILQAYNDSVNRARGAIFAPHMDPEDLKIALAQAPFIRNEHERRCFEFRMTIKSSLENAPVGQSLGDTIIELCRYEKRNSPGNELDACEIIAFIRGDNELQRTLNARLDKELVGVHKSVLPRLARWIKRVYGDALPCFSLLEIADRMKHEDSCFTPALVTELFTHCPEVLGAMPDADTRRNFMLAVTVANTMQRMWAGATHRDVVGFLKALGPNGNIPQGVTPEHIKLLEGYDFVPRWPNGVKPNAKTDSEAHAMRALERELERPVSLLRGGMDAQLREGAAQVLASHEVPDPVRIEEMVARCFRPVCETKLVALAERNGNLDAGMVGYLLDAVREGRYDDLLKNPSWRTAFRLRRSSGVIEDSVVAEETFKLISQFREGERDAAHAIELAAYRYREASVALDNFDKIPRVLPITQATVEDVKAKVGRPFENARVVMVQHELGQAFAQVEAYRALGMDPKKCIFIGKPYHPNPSVEHALLNVAGVSGRFSERGDLESMQRQARDAVDEAMAKRAPDEIVLIVGDGPWIRDYVDEKYLSKDPSLAKYVRFTEQTAIGHRERDMASTNKRVVSYARTRQKVIEAPYIGRAGVNAVERVMANLTDTFENKLVWINGIAGPIGRAAAEAYMAHGARVAGWDPAITDETRAWARTNGIPIYDNDQAMPDDVFMVAGAAGACTINKDQIDRTTRRADGGPTYYVSFSSEYVEIDRKHLQARATDANGNIRKLVATMVNDQPTYYYWLDDGTVRSVIADGLPVNFQGINSVAPEVIDATMALSVAAAAEACMSDALGFVSASQFTDVVEREFESYLARSVTQPRSKPSA